MENNEENLPGDEQKLTPATETENNVTASLTEVQADIALPAATEHDHEDDAHDDLHPEEDFSGLGKDELLQKMEECFAAADPEQVKHTVRKLKEIYREHAREELEAKKRAWEEQKEDEHDLFMPSADKRDERFEELLRKYNLKRTDSRRDREKQLKHNLQVKLTIIEELKQLHETSDSMQKAFDKLQDLQTRWREAGAVPQGYSDDLWKSYHHHIARFYDVVKISRELRDLDMKKNAELKEELIAKVEALKDVTSVRDALHQLRDLHAKWREIGFSAKETNDELWERFKAVSDKVHERRKELEAGLKVQREINLKAKIALCEEMEKMAETTYDSHKGWQDGNKAIEEVFGRWRKVGFVPKEDEDNTWKRFKEARNKFFRNRETFYGQQRDIFKENLQKKIALCEEAEKLQESTDWKNTANIYKKLQDKWKAIGPVSRKQSDRLWKRFKTAGDKFFENRGKHFAESDAALAANAQAREQFIAGMASVELTDNLKDNKAVIAKIQEDWNALGEMPRNDRNRLEAAFREAMSKVYELLKEKAGGDDKVLQRLKYEQLSQTENGRDQLYRERMNLQDRIKKLQNEINTLENNIGFFGKSKGAKNLVTEYQEKIDAAKTEVDKLKVQLKMIPRE
ncbi:MAG: hypothetical protein FD123_2804 [Bacteroidetes bacterium]|nr:MAG: hypothetical protein FD123_2804 [Bacteroidota bacterium]